MSMKSSDTGTFSFDSAAPVEVADGLGSRPQSTGTHHSPDESGSFSNVQSIPHSDSTKRSRHAIEDAERESRPVCRVRGSPARSSRTPSGKTPSIKRMFGRPRSTGGSPRGRGSVVTADEELEARIGEMENDGDAMRVEVKQIEDEHLAEKVQFHSMIQNARDECREFDGQHDHVIGCWRDAEERSRKFQSGFPSEAMLLHEAKGYLQEMQQQFGSVIQED